MDKQCEERWKMRVCASNKLCPTSFLDELAIRATNLRYRDVLELVIANDNTCPLTRKRAEEALKL